MARNFPIAIILSLSTVALEYTMANSKLVTTMKSFEDTMYDLSDKVKEYYTNCDHTCQTTSSNTNVDNKCAMDACTASFYDRENSGFVETNDFGASSCSGMTCNNATRYLDFIHSGVSNADKTYRTSDIQNRGDVACWTNQLDSEWKSNVNMDSLTWQYFGTPSGLHRTYPGFPQETCGDYDPRLRSWYVAATTGPKDVVLIIDKSGSMNDKNRMQLAIDAAVSVISALTILDYFNVVMFSNNADVLMDGMYLVRATQENKDEVIAKVKAVSADGGTNMQSGFDVTYQLLKNSKDKERTSNCNQVILFLTDGVPTAGIQIEDELVNHITNANILNATIFTYALGSGAKYPIPKAIACANGGIFTPVSDGSTSLRTQMSYYYDFIASLRTGESKVVWVEPYIDMFGAGKMTTAALAVYDDRTSPVTLLGVLGFDITVDAMEILEPNANTFLDMFIQRSSPNCPASLNLDECAMERLRSKNYAKLDPEYFDMNDPAELVDRTCTATDCGVEDKAQVCAVGTRFAGWCPANRISFENEACVGCSKIISTGHTTVASLYVLMIAILGSWGAMMMM